LNVRRRAKYVCSGLVWPLFPEGIEFETTILVPDVIFTSSIRGFGLAVRGRISIYARILGETQ